MAQHKLAFSIPEAVAVSSIKQTSLYKAIKDKQLKVRKFATRTVITRTDLEKFLEKLPTA